MQTRPTRIQITRLKPLDLEHANVAMETDDETLLVVDDALKKLEQEQAAAAERAWLLQEIRSQQAP